MSVADGVDTAKCHEVWGITAKMIARLGSRVMALFHKCRVEGLNLKLNENKNVPALLW